MFGIKKLKNDAEKAIHSISLLQSWIEIMSRNFTELQKNEERFSKEYSKLCSKVEEQGKTIEKLQWEISNPAMFALGKTYKEYGVLESMKVEKSEDILYQLHPTLFKIRLDREYTFKQKEKTITVWHTNLINNAYKK